MFCRDNDIKIKLTNIYTRQKNGVEEPNNHTLLGMAISMITFRNLCPLYSTKEMCNVVYLRNRSPTSSLDGITPYDAWFGFKPRVKHLIVFSSICYALVQKEKRTNLDS